MTYKQNKTAELVSYLSRFCRKRTIEIKPFLNRVGSKLRSNEPITVKELNTVLKFVAVETGKPITQLQKEYSCVTVGTVVTDDEVNNLMMFIDQ